MRVNGDIIIDKNTIIYVSTYYIPFLGIFNGVTDSICGGVEYPEENYEDPEDDGGDTLGRRKRDANNPEDTLPHIENAHYRYHVHY